MTGQINLNSAANLSNKWVPPLFVCLFFCLNTNSRYGRPYEPGTVNRKVALLKRIFNLAIREDMVLKKPCWKVAMLPENNQRERILSPDEYQALFE